MLINPKSMSSNLHLPNGSLDHITRTKNVKIVDSLILHLVLCVPCFHCHLISSSKLTSQSFYTVLFSANNCVLQDQSQKRMIEIGSHPSSLYNLIPSLISPHSTNSVASAKTHMWHARMGHPSYSILQHLLESKNVVYSDLTSCDVCLRAINFFCQY